MNPPTHIFPIATTYPDFFNTNLSDPNRIIKLIQGKYCSIRAFYYQLLKLVFQLEVKRDGEDINFAQILIANIDKALSKMSAGANAAYLKHQSQLIEKFVNELLANDETQFQSFLNKNINVDTALIMLFQEILRQGGVANSSIQQVFGYLSSLFGQRVTQIDKCIKFDESDVFVYIQTQSKLYLAFLNLEQQEENENSIDKVILTNQQNQKIGEDNKKPKKTQNDTIMNIFGDMLHSSKHDGDSKVSNSFLTNNLNNSLSPGKKDEQFSAGLKTASKSYNQFIPKYPPQQQTQNLTRTVDDQPFAKSESRVQKYQLSKDSGIINRQVRFQDHSPDNTLYRPKTKNPTLQTISEVTASKQSLLYSRQNKRDPLDYADEEQKGTYYRQFTDTRILNILPEPQKSTVKMLKNRFIGMHSRNLTKKI